MESRKEIGFVYITGDDGNVKIGASKDPSNRIKVVLNQSGSSRNSKRFISCGMFNYFEVESIAHKKFSKNRLNGEWFGVSFQDAVDFVCSASAPPSESELNEASIANKKYDARVSKNASSMAKMLLNQEGTSSQYKSIMADTVAMSMIIEDTDVADKLMSCNGDMLRLMTVRSMIQSEVIKELSSALQIDFKDPLSLGLEGGL